MLLDGDRRLEVTAQLYREGASQILLYHCPPNRLERLGILPTGEVSARRELLKRHVSDDDLVVLSGDSAGRSEIAAALVEWLKENPRETVNVPCDRFSSRAWRIVLRRAADPLILDRIRIIALPNRRFDETNWWKSKPGLRAFANGYLTLAFLWRGPQNEGESAERTPAEFRAAFTAGAAP